MFLCAISIPLQKTPPSRGHWYSNRRWGRGRGRDIKGLFLFDAQVRSQCLGVNSTFSRQSTSCVLIPHSTPDISNRRCLRRNKPRTGSIVIKCNTNACSPKVVARLLVFSRLHTTIQFRILSTQFEISNQFFFGAIYLKQFCQMPLHFVTCIYFFCVIESW